MNPGKIILFEKSPTLKFGCTIEPLRKKQDEQRSQNKTLFEKNISCFSRIFSKNQNNDQDVERKSKMREKINLVLKEVMYNSVAQAIIKIFHTPHLVLKLSLTLFVLLTISIR